MVNDFEQANTNIALVQSGTKGVDRSGYVLGAKAGYPQFFGWEHLVQAFGSNNPDFLSYYNHFLGATAAIPSPLQQDLGSTGTVTSASSKLIMTTAAGAGDWVTVALGLHFTVSNGFTFFEATFDAPSLAGKTLEIGLSDAISEAAGLAFSSHTTPTDVATNAVVLAYQDGGSANWLLDYVNAGTSAVVDTETAADTSAHTLKLIIGSDGHLWAWLDGTLIADVEEAVATTAVLTPWFTVVSAGAAEVLNVDFFRILGEAS